ncbi:MucB/RseB C-terminal domain-containing protein [Gilliamella sp. Bif1-4]|jgi:negative regulator of sigma E activity|uniref:MucB/RseB C-terminal domain-containing protein n=1 Tax=Gilliamella sp. Bif1-4 TaxID=3120233 RepID=UPI0009C02C71|nr:MucB/RseB C-terminal domain-containing protein [Gilliamella apicola]
MKLPNCFIKYFIKQSRKIIFTLFFTFFSVSIYANDTEDAFALLNKMNHAVQTQDYRIYFVSQDKNQYVTTFEYSHIGAPAKEDINAYLRYLEGSDKEIILHKGITSYFQPNSSSFSITSSRIIEAFPDVVYNNFNDLKEVYDFIFLGKARTANRSAKLVKIIAKEQDRYSYVIWIDDETFLPIRIDLLDQNSDIINQIKVIKLDKNFDKKKQLDYINSRTYPILLSIEKQNNAFDQWRLAWLPKGFKEVATYNLNFYSSDIATKLFSDGVFSFTVNISSEQAKQSNQIIQQGGRTIYSTNLGHKNIIIIGNLPRTTVERIVQNIVQK